MNIRVPVSFQINVFVFCRYISTMGYYLAIKKEWYFAICNNLEGTMVSEINQTNTVCYHLYAEAKK